MVAYYKKKEKKKKRGWIISNKSTVNISAFKTARNIRAVNVGSYDKDVNPILSPDELIVGTRMGMDSYTDTTCVHKHAYIESIVEGFTVDSIPFDDSIGKLSDLPIVHAIYAYNNPETVQTLLLRFNHAIYIKGMDNALLCPNQAREHGIIVDDIPLHLDHTGYGTFLRRPTDEELENLSREIIDITDENEWDPYNLSEFPSVMLSTISLYTHDGIDDWLLDQHNRKISALYVSKPPDKLTPEYLAQICKCGLETARKTIEASTCMHYRNVRNGLTKRFRPARNFMRYRLLRLPAGEFYTDTMMSKIRSLRGYNCAQIYGNKFGYIKAYPMDDHNKQSVGDTLTLMIQDTGVMQKLHTDNASEMVGRKTPCLLVLVKKALILLLSSHCDQMKMMVRFLLK